MTKTIQNLNKNNLILIKQTLTDNGVIAFPTDTVFGLACFYKNLLAKKKIYNMKLRNEKKTLPILVSSIKHIEEYFSHKPSPLFYQLANHFWPGALTIVTNVKNKMLAFRVPNHPIPLKVISHTNEPLACTSYNISKQKPCLTFENTFTKLKILPDIIINGKVQTKIASTVIAINKNKITFLREGSISKKQIQDYINK